MKKLIGLSIIALSVILFSCNNEKVTNPANDEVLTEKAAQITLNEAEMESASLEVNYEVDFYANAEVRLCNGFGMGKLWKWGNHLRYRINNCPLVNIESETGGYPKTITLDYGDSTVLRNGKVLSGVVLIEISGPRSSEDYTRLITYQDFGVDSVLINGTASVAFTKGEDVFRTFESTIIFTLADGTTVNRESVRQWQWIEGMNTDVDQTDDMIQITGYTNAETSDGDVYKKEIVDPLIRIRDCPYIVQGVVDISMNGDLISSLDYGEGECNDMAILTKDGETYEVELHLRKYVKKN
ncbi:MAG TPA: hypothetical protein VKA38_10510 [Draconibacterium sp.]|nr:hypothetical protein [Draconibacterium sp.]